MDSKSNLSQQNLCELNNLHKELEAYNDFINDSEIKFSQSYSQSLVELSTFQSNLNIEEKHIYDKKMEFLSDERFFPSRSEKTKSEIIKNFPIYHKNSIEREKIDEEDGNKESNQYMGLLKRFKILNILKRAFFFLYIYIENVFVLYRCFS